MILTHEYVKFRPKPSHKAKLSKKINTATAKERKSSIHNKSARLPNLVTFHSVLLTCRLHLKNSWQRRISIPTAALPAQQQKITNN